MQLVMTSLARALLSQLHFRMLLLTILPFVLSLLLWGVVLWLGLQPMIDWLHEYFVDNQLFQSAASVLGWFGLGAIKTVLVPLIAMWLLLPLMLVALFAFRRGGMFAAVLVVACLPRRPAAAADEGTFWRRADQIQHARMQQGADAFRKKNYAAAEQAWSALPAADAAYNRGNALAQAGRYEDAIAAYDKALQQQPGMDDALANKRAVQNAMNRKPPPSKKPNGRGKQQKSENGRPNDGKSDPQDGASPPSDNRTDGQQPSDAKDKPPSGTPGDGQDSPADDSKQKGQTREPNDAKAQADADAEQRKRMQHALQGKQGGQPEKKDGAPGSVAQAKPGDAADRERQRANDAWLKRVPDDPGGLLRAKFQLEYERRQESGER